MSNQKAIKEINQIEIKAQRKYDEGTDGVDDVAIPSYGFGRGVVKSPIAKLIDELSKITSSIKGINIIDGGFAYSGIVYPNMAQDCLQENIEKTAKKHNYIVAGECQQLQKDIDERKPEFMTVSLKKNGLYHVDYTTFEDVAKTASALINNIVAPTKD